MAFSMYSNHSLLGRYFACSGPQWAYMQSSLSKMSFTFLWMVPPAYVFTYCRRSPDRDRDRDSPPRRSPGYWTHIMASRTCYMYIHLFLMV